MKLTLSWKARAALLVAALIFIGDWSRNVADLATPLGIVDQAFGFLASFTIWYLIFAVILLLWHGGQYAVALIGNAHGKPQEGGDGE